MIILQIEHPVPDYKSWKAAFERDPVDRKGSGVRRYSVLRLTDDPNYIIINLEFDNLADANATLDKLHSLWKNVEGKIIFSPKTRILELLEAE
jgi:hypothetical protein